ncbi:MULTISPECIES: phage tail protein [Lachnospiraceae]|jgi:phage-related protein|uniref:Phage tail protein n=1 Tax=Mediterraneibacter gnavus TaxID=33038 RepID=A0A2N5PMH7_MEDGN|nr:MULTISPECIES: hypothetical protein [Lachnospiraceae]PLT76347.1 hypothetical protein CDL23_04840 [Mediterraneibacter gnavus]
MDLFKLVGTIAINNSEANSQIEGTTEKASTFSSKLSSGIGTVAKWGTAIVGGATVAGTALVGFATKSASTADNIDKMSQKIGISRQAYQELDFICSQSGTSVDTLQAGMKSLTSAMDGAKSGTKANVEQFERLGVAVTNSDGTFRSQEDVMWDTLSALQGMEDQTEKARLATELFGRSGTELMPLLNGEAGSIEEMKKQAHDLGLVLDDELIDNGVNLTDSLDQTKRAFQSIGTQLGASLMPIVEQASDYIQQALPSIQALIQRLSPIITSLLDSLLPPLMDLASTIFPILMDLIEQLIPPVTQIVQAILPIIVQLIQMLLPPIVQIVQMVLPILVQLITALLPLLQPILELLQPLIDLLMVLLEPLIELLNLILPPLIQVITAVVQVIVGVLQPVIEALATVLGDVLGVAFKAIGTVVKAVVDAISGDWSGLKNILTTVWNAIKSVAETVWNGIKTFLSNLMNGIKTTISNVWNGIKNTVSTVINAIKTVIETVFNAVKTFISNVWNGIKTTVSNVVNGIKTTISNVFNAIKTTISNILNGVKTTFSNVWNGIKTTVTNVINGIKTGISNGLNGAKNVVTNVLNGIKNSFSNIFENVKNVVKGAIDKIKGFFQFKVELPKIKLPHFGISPSGWQIGDLLKGSIPKLGIEWYAKAMDKGMIMNQPTIFGYDSASQNFLAGGEAGSETVVGTQNLMEMIQTAVNSENSILIQFFTKLIALLEDFFPQVLENMGYDLVLDTGALVAETAPQMDEELGKIFKRKGRQ